MKHDIPGMQELLAYLESSGITVCILYGSAVSKRNIPKSDIDLSIAADEPLRPEARVQHYLKAVDCLHKEVDLSDLAPAVNSMLKARLEALLNGK